MGGGMGVRHLQRASCLCHTFQRQQHQLHLQQCVTGLTGSQCAPAMMSLGRNSVAVFSSMS